MLVIRLARTGRKKFPTYRIVAAESARPATGKFVAVLGHYNPHTKELVIKKEEVTQYMKNGAQPSEAVARLFLRDKLEMPKWVKVTQKNKKPKHAPSDTEENTAPAVPESSAEKASEHEEAVQKDADAAAEDEVAAPAETETEPVRPDEIEESATEVAEVPPDGDKSE